MSTVYNDIDYVLNERLNDMIGLPDVAWENSTYKPIIGTTFIRPTLLPANTFALTSTDDNNSGIYQINIFTKLGNGSDEAKRLVDVIGDRFKPVTELTKGSLLVRCMSVSVSPGIIEKAWYTLIVKIKYLAITTKRN